jgi:hypothetical protein
MYFILRIRVGEIVGQPDEKGEDRELQCCDTIILHFLRVFTGPRLACTVLQQVIQINFQSSLLSESERHAQA